MKGNAVTASKQDLRRWFETGIKTGATHLIVARDTFDNSNYPVYVGDKHDGEDVHAKEDELRSQPMTGVDEVYCLSMDMENQLNQPLSFNY